MSDDLYHAQVLYSWKTADGKIADINHGTLRITIGGREGQIQRWEGKQKCDAVVLFDGSTTTEIVHIIGNSNHNLRLQVIDTCPMN